MRDHARSTFCSSTSAPSGGRSRWPVKMAAMRARMAALVTLAAVGGVVPACSRGGTSVPAPPAGPPKAEARIGLVEWGVATSAGAFVRGEVTLRVTNAGTTIHDLRVKGARVDVRTRLLGPRETTDLSVDLDGEREVELSCTVPGHRGQGMIRRLPVRPGG